MLPVILTVSPMVCQARTTSKTAVMISPSIYWEYIMQLRHHMRGFTILELMIVVTLIGILAGLAAPEMGRLIERNRIQSASEDIHSMLQYARAEAATKSVTIQIKSATPGDWAKGTEVWHATTLIRKSPGSAEVKLTAPGPADLSFRPNGTLTTNVVTTINICFDDELATGRVIEIQPSGRIILRPRSTHPTTCAQGV